MANNCPHCGLAIHESQQICRECDALFHSNGAPAPPVMPPSTPPAKAPAIDIEGEPRPLKKVQPLNGIKLVGIAVACYALGRLVALGIGGNTTANTLLPHLLALGLMVAGIVIFILGVVRLLSGSGARK